MNIDLLMTRRNEAGLVYDQPLEFNPTHAILDYDSGYLTLYGNNQKSLWMNIPVSSETIEILIQTKGLHLGLIRSGIIEAISYVTLVISVAFDINVPRIEPSPRKSAVSYEIFMRECSIGQAVHRDDLSNNNVSSSILEDLSPSVLKFAPTLANQKTMEMAYKNAPTFAPTLGMGLGGSSSSTPVNRPPIANKSNMVEPDREPAHNPMSFFTQGSIRERAYRKKEERNAEAKNVLDKDLSEILRPIETLIGMAPLKDKISSIAHLTQAKALRTLNGLPNTAFSLHMIFTGPSGTGKTTAARMVGKIMKDLGYLATGHVVETRPSVVYRKGIQELFEEAEGGILFIDEAYGLADVDDFDSNDQYMITSLLQLMEQYSDRVIVIIAGYANEMRRFISVNPGLPSRFSISIDFPNYSAEELLQIFEKLCADNYYTLLPETKTAVLAYLSRITSSEAVRAFGNGRGVRNLFERSLMQQAERLVKNKISDPDLIRQIVPTDVVDEAKIVPNITNEELEKLLEPLNKMIGLQNVKNDIHDLVYLLRAHTLRQQSGLPIPPVVLHSLFMGPPGTGKTTVARLLGKILKRLGYLEKGHVVEVDKQKMTGKWLGWSEKISAEAFHEAMGGILFIDEAYSLSGDQVGNDYGHAALTTILKLMEDHRDKVVVICAGYEKEMKKFLESNPGLESRFPRHVVFPPYTHDELVALFLSLCEENKYAPTEEALAKLQKQIRAKSEDEINILGNARFIRNIFEKTIVAQSRRITSLPVEITQISEIIESDITVPDNTSGQDKRVGFV